MAYFGLTGLGNKDNAVLRGGLLGAGAFLWRSFRKGKKGKKKSKNWLTKQLYALALYTTAGAIAGEIVKHTPPIGTKQKPEIKAKEELKPTKMEGSTSDKLLSTVLYVDSIPVGYEIYKNDASLFYRPTKYSSKECCPPQFSVTDQEGEWIFEPTAIDPYLKDQVIQDIRKMRAGNFLN